MKKFLCFILFYFLFVNPNSYAGLKTNLIKDINNTTAITFDGSGNTTINGTLTGNNSITANSGANQTQLNTVGTIYSGTARPQRSFFVGAGGIWCSATSGCSSLANYEYPTYDVNMYRLTFNGTGRTYAETTIAMPKSWDGGVIYFIPYWTTDNGTAGQTVEWEFAGRSYGDNENIDQSWGAAITSTDSYIAANYLHIAPETSAVTLAGTPVGEELVQIRISRDGAGDSHTGNAYFLGFLVKYTATKENDD